MLKRSWLLGPGDMYTAGNDGADIDGPLTTMPVSVLAAVRGKPGPVNLQVRHHELNQCISASVI